jgi:ABC-type Fe3+-hydroxamate transport system substrate-binding protein
MPAYTDQTGRKVCLDGYPEKIISVVPSQTELLYDLGLEKEVIGITKFCVRPAAWYQSKTRVGGTKQLNIQIIRQLHPDLILANKEENVKEQVDELEKYFPVWVSDVHTLADALEMIQEVGAMTGKEQKAARLMAAIQSGFSRLPVPAIRYKVCYLIWQKPFMTVGGDTFIHSMLEAAGFENVFKNKSRYPQINLAEIMNAGCEILLLSSEPFPFRQKHADELQLLLPGIKILPVDGEFFSWYGSRLLQAPGYFQKIHQVLNNSEAY